MFIRSSKCGYDRFGQQRASGYFLTLFNMKAGGELRTIVRHVSLHQLGHFMMGTLKVKAPDLVVHKIVLSGTYGDDGLPVHAPELWPWLNKVPDDLTAEFWKGGGHNGAGAEAQAMHKWATENFELLRHYNPEVVKKYIDSRRVRLTLM